MTQFTESYIVPQQQPITTPKINGQKVQLWGKRDAQTGNSSRATNQKFKFEAIHEIQISKSHGLGAAFARCPGAFHLPTARTVPQEPQQRVSVPYDWSHHHLKFRTPQTLCKPGSFSRSHGTCNRSFE